MKGYPTGIGAAVCCCPPGNVHPALAPVAAALLAAIVAGRLPPEHLSR